MLVDVISPNLTPRAIDRTKRLATKPGCYRPPDALIAFLESL
jgi:hypothetical protein